MLQQKEALDKASDQIKSATAILHASAEKQLIGHIKSIRDIDGYAALLQCMHGYFLPLEQLLDGYGDELTSDYPSRRKASRLSDDLQVLEYPVAAELCKDRPAINTRMHALGCLYVMEGSSLGGLVIKQIINKNCHDIPAEAFSFFSGYGDNTMNYWKTFVAEMNQSIKSEKDLNDAIEGARATFSKMESWIASFYSRNHAALF